MRMGPRNVPRRLDFHCGWKYGRIAAMLLDKLLDYVTVHSEPVATCLLISGWRLSLPGPPGVMFHIVMPGNDVLRGPEGQQ